MNQTLEDLLRACVLDFDGSWDNRSFLTIVVSNLVLVWHLSRHSMEGHADLLLVGLRPVRSWFYVQISFVIPQKRLTLFVIG